MISIVVTRGHRKTLRALRRTSLPIRLWTYDRLLGQRSLPGGTWIFSDIERLDPFELRLAGEVARLLGEGGASVLNDPARVRYRHALLRALHAAGINDFTAYQADQEPRPRRFPVFIKAENAHDAPLGGLILSQSVLEAELERLRASGQPLRGLLVIELRAEEAWPGVWRRFSSFRIGDRVFAHHTAVDYTWAVKYGDPARLAGDARVHEFVAAETGFIERNDHAALVRKATEIASIDYGRVDFGIADGRICVFEINTNPAINFGQGAIAPAREANQRRGERLIIDALTALDTAGSKRVRLDSPVLRVEQRLSRRFVRSRVRP